MAVLSGSKTCLQILGLIPGIDLNTRNFSGEAPLHEAVRKQNRDFVVYLVERGAELDARDGRGSTPLAVASREAQTSIAQYLLKSGSSVDHRDYSGSTPLYYSVEAGQLDLVKLLVQSGASPLARNAAGDSPLMASLKKGSSILRELIGVSGVEKTDSEGRTALRILVDAGASAEMLKLALAAGADPSSRDRMADTPLHAAIAKKDFATAALLLGAKADPFAPNSQGDTPLKMVFIESVGNLRDFVKAAGPSAVDVLGDGFLHHAVREGKIDAARILLDMGLDRGARNISGESPLDKAKTKNDAGMIALLSQ